MNRFLVFIFLSIFLIKSSNSLKCFGIDAHEDSVCSGSGNCTSNDNCICESVWSKWPLSASDCSTTFWNYGRIVISTFTIFFIIVVFCPQTSSLIIHRTSEGLSLFGFSFLFLAYAFNVCASLIENKKVFSSCKDIRCVNSIFSVVVVFTSLLGSFGYLFFYIIFFIRDYGRSGDNKIIKVDKKEKNLSSSDEPIKTAEDNFVELEEKSGKNESTLEVRSSAVTAAEGRNKSGKVKLKSETPIEGEESDGEEVEETKDDEEEALDAIVSTRTHVEVIGPQCQSSEDSSQDDDDEESNNSLCGHPTSPNSQAPTSFTATLNKTVARSIGRSISYTVSSLKNASVNSILASTDDVSISSKSSDEMMKEIYKKRQDKLIVRILHYRPPKKIHLILAFFVSFCVFSIVCVAFLATILFLIFLPESTFITVISNIFGYTGGVFIVLRWVPQVLLTLFDFSSGNFNIFSLILGIPGNFVMCIVLFVNGENIATISLFIAMCTMMSLQLILVLVVGCREKMIKCQKKREEMNKKLENKLRINNGVSIESVLPILGINFCF